MIKFSIYLHSSGGGAFRTVSIQDVIPMLLSAYDGLERMQELLTVCAAFRLVYSPFEARPLQISHSTEWTRVPSRWPTLSPSRDSFRKHLAFCSTHQRDRLGCFYRPLCFALPLCLRQSDLGGLISVILSRSFGAHSRASKQTQVHEKSFRTLLNPPLIPWAVAIVY